MSLSLKELKSGKSYVHHNGIFIRTIDAISGETVYWHDQSGPGQCTRKIFQRQCVAVATEDDMEAMRQREEENTSRQIMADYESIKERRRQRFADECNDAKKRGHHYIVVSSPHELGWNYEEIMESLAMLEKQQLYLRIMKS